MATQPIYQFYSCLQDYKPKIWRRFQVAGNINLARLGYIVMTMYEMQASHLFCIDWHIKEEMQRAMKKRGVVDNSLWDHPEIYHYQIISDEDDFGDVEEDDSIRDATEMTLRRLTHEPGFLLYLQYDYGDGWEVKLELEKVFQDDTLPGKELPRVLGGEGYGIIEDCGGVCGLEELAAAFRKKSGPEYEVFSEWLGCDELDLTAFDLEDMNFRLKKIPRIYRDIYELGLEPTKQSIDLLNRRYLK